MNVNVELNPLQEKNRQIIGPGTEILGGKLLMRAAVVVDNDENPAVYEAVLADFDAARRAIYGGMPLTTLSLMKLTNSVARRSVPFDDEKYKAVLKKEAVSRGLDRLTTEDEVGLSTFIGNAGICYEHSLVSGTILRMLQERGDIEGTVSITTSDVLEVPGLVTSRPVPHTKTVFSDGEGRQHYAIDTHSGVVPMPRAS